MGLTNGRTVFAPIVGQLGDRRYTMSLTRWKPTTLRLGVGVAKQFREIVRCGAGSVIEKRVIFEYNPQLEEFS